MQPFIRNHHYNYIKKQALHLQQAIRTAADLKVVQTVRSNVISNILELFPEASDSQKQLLESVAEARTAEDFQAYYRLLEPLLLEFAPVTDKQIRSLFPKNKKLKMPDLTLYDRRFVTYLGWNDIATGKMFMVCELDGNLVGIEGRFTPTHKKGYCFICNKMSEVGLFSAISKAKPKNASPDYYKAVGNYMCQDSKACNSNVADVSSLTRFVLNVLHV